MRWLSRWHCAAEALLATLAGIVFGPLALGIFNPASWSADPEYLTFQTTRIVIAIQVLFTGIALPKAYLLKEWRSLLILLGPVMTTAWFVVGTWVVRVLTP
jgi:NhaP-type Na+/H+ or K+/H+ antiporter